MPFLGCFFFGGGGVFLFSVLVFGSSVRALVIIFALLHLYKYDFLPGHVAHLSVWLPPLFPCTVQTGCAFSQITLLANELCFLCCWCC